MKKKDNPVPSLNTPTLLTFFGDQPHWCRFLKSVDNYKGFKLGQLVLDLNNTLARIVHIASSGDIRLALIDEQGNVFANSTSFATMGALRPYNWKTGVENGVETDKERPIYSAEELKNFGLWLRRSLESHKNKTIGELFSIWCNL